MKKISLFLVVIFLASFSSLQNQVSAQDQTKSDKEKEIQMQKEIEAQKKAMSDQKKALEDAHQVIIEGQTLVADSLKDLQFEIQSDGDGYNVFRSERKRGARAFAPPEPFIYNIPNADSFWQHGMGGDSESTSWDFSKTVKENTFSKEYAFDVEKSATSVIMSIMGDCKAGEIRIKIVMPNGKNYSDILIDEFGNLNWRKSFTISEKENQDKAGEWKFQINSTKATGYFKISLQTY
jgi:hypothetical protein